MSWYTHLRHCARSQPCCGFCCTSCDKCSRPDEHRHHAEAYGLDRRLLSTSVAGQTTSYSYKPAGRLKKATPPALSWIGYDYDAAHRQVAVYDHLGNRTDYVLDNAGALKRQLGRSIDALGRIQQATGRE